MFANKGKTGMLAQLRLIGEEWEELLPRGDYRAVYRVTGYIHIKDNIYRENIERVLLELVHKNKGE